MYTQTRSIPRLAQLLGGLATASLLFAGCANMVTTAPAVTEAGATISGTVFGGSTAIGGATVKLYSIGTSGYGSAGTLMASTTTSTDGNASFSFVQIISGTPSGNQYKCPITPTQVYIIANGGNTGTGTNAAAAFLTALGVCPTPAAASATHYVNLNEAVTAANAFALAQYINPGTTPGTESIGISGTALSATAYANAVSTISNLILYNQPAPATTYGGPNPSVSGVTVTATPETSKLTTISNILAACVDTSSSGSQQLCTDLFNNVTLPIASTTSRPTATYATPQDTIQAAYMLAVTPANGGAFSSCPSNSGATTRTGCLFGLIQSNGAPYAGGLTAVPSDFTLGVTYTASGTCTGGGLFITGPYHANVDGSGNIWFMNGGATMTSNISEMSPKGVPLLCTGSGAAGRGLTIDVAGNVWGSYNGNTTGGGIVEIPAGGTSAVTWPITSGQQSYLMTSDGFGNVYYNVNATGGSVYEFVNAASATAPFSPTQIIATVSGSNTVVQGGLQVDSVGRLWDAPALIDLFAITPKVQASITAYQVSSGSVTFTATNSFTVGQVVQVNGLTTTEGLTLDYQTYTVTAATASSFTAATSAATIASTTDSGTGTLTASYNGTLLPVATAALYGIGIDSNNNIYQGTTCCGSGAPYRTATKWTPAASVASSTYTQSATNFAGTNGTRSLVIDGASNVFVGNEFPNSSGATATVGTYSVSEYTTSGSGFTALSPAGATPTSCTTSGCGTTGGFFDADFNEPFDMEVDPSGNLWVMNSGTAGSATGASTSGTSITELVGVAVPVVTPLSIAVKNGQLGTKP